MSIENHYFHDEDLTLRSAMTDKLEINCDLEDIEDMKYIEITREDVIAMASHFEIKESEL